MIPTQPTEMLQDLQNLTLACIVNKLPLHYKNMQPLFFHTNRYLLSTRMSKLKKKNSLLMSNFFEFETTVYIVFRVFFFSFFNILWMEFIVLIGYESQHLMGEGVRACEGVQL